MKTVVPIDNDGAIVCEKCDREPAEVVVYGEIDAQFLCSGCM